MDRIPPSCPDSEALAAWLDQGVGAAEREQIEAHLAACDRCRRLVASVLETQTAVHEPEEAGAPAGSAEQFARSADVSARRGDARLGDAPAQGRAPGSARRTIAWGAASVLAAAAMLAVAVQIAPSWWRPWRTGGIDSKLADLAAAVGGERTVEARLTGGFRHGPVRAPVRSGGSPAATDNWTLLAAAGRIREDADRDPTAANLHALGLAHLVLGEYEPAVRALEDAIAEDPDNARYQCDLAAAYLARARHLDRPDDLPRALGAAERAVKQNDALLEARFNRALALEALFLDDQARAAWEDYIARDPGSGWAEEARQHLQALQQKEAARPDLTQNNGPPPVTDTTVEAGLDWLLRQGLPAWADAVLENDVDRAANERSSLTTFARQLSEISGDRFPAGLVDVTSGDVATHARRARTVRAFATALAHVDAANGIAAEAVLPDACAQAPDVIAILCEFHLGAIEVRRRDDAGASQRVRRMLARAAERQWLYPANLAKWLKGYRVMFRGEYALAAEPYREAHDGLRAAKYLTSAGNLATQLADLSDLVGLPAEGWRWRRSALHLTTLSGSPMLRYLTRLQTAGALIQQRDAEAAAVVIGDISDDVTTSLSDLRRAALEITRARIALATGDKNGARTSVKRARNLIDRSQDLRVQRLAPELLSVQSTLEQRDAQLDAARATITSAIASMGPERAADRATALLTRANLLAYQSDDIGNAEADINAAIGLLKMRAVDVTGQPIRLEEVALAFDAVASLISDSSSLQNFRGAYLVEQLRQVLNGVPAGSKLSSENELARAVARQPSESVSVSFLLSENSLLTWVLSATGTRFVSRPVDVERLHGLLSALTVQVYRTPDRDDLWRATLAALYNLLLHDLPAIAQATDIAIVPDGVLSRVPFGALFDASTNEYLFERSSVRVVPNLAFAFEGSQSPTIEKAAPTTAVIVGDPQLLGSGARVFERLPRARVEAFEVARLYKDAKVIVGDQATKARVLDALAVADVVHFAGHAIAEPTARPARLLLAGDVGDPRTALSGEDLRHRSSKGVRVVLAACETGATSADHVSSLASLSAAFLRAGATSVVANLWQLDDTASEKFFLGVHRELVAGRPTATAVARAQRACRRDAECRRSPATWVGTTVYGSH